MNSPRHLVNYCLGGRYRDIRPGHKSYQVPPLPFFGVQGGRMEYPTLIPDDHTTL